MALELLDIASPQIAYILFGGFIVVISMIWLLVTEKLYINEVVLGTLFGIVVGPHCINAFDPREWGSDPNAVTLEVMRVVLGVGLFAIGVELPCAYMASHIRGLLVMVVPTMAIGWVVVAGFIHLLFPALNFVSALVIAACLTPTDPVICAAIVGGKFATKHVSAELLHILAAEAAANDGLAYPFLSLSIYLTVEASRSDALWKWVVVGIIYQVILGIFLGAILGYSMGQLIRLCYKKQFIDRRTYTIQYIATTVFTVGLVSMIGSDDLLAAFAAGSAINWDGKFDKEIQNDTFRFPSVIDSALNCGCFIYIGAWLPFTAFNSPELGIVPWRLIVLLVAILSLRRIPPLLLLYRWVPEIATWREAFFSGHFGPMGVSAVFVSTLALTRLPIPHAQPESQPELLAATLPTIVAFVVLGSIVIHGLSVPLFAFACGRGLRVSLKPCEDDAGTPDLESTRGTMPAAGSVSEEARPSTGCTQSAESSHTLLGPH